MLEQATLNFLEELKKNNNRDWFAANKKTYDTARANFITLVEELIPMLGAFDSAIKELEAKNCLFRIYRDVRFAADKSPYKINFSAVFAGGGKNKPGPCYYLHLQPGGCFVAGGYWMPEAEHLKAIRQEIDYNGEELKKIINSTGFVKAFGKLNEEDKLKTAPKGYSSDHADIELLKLKSFTVSSAIDDKKFLEKGIAESVTTIWKELLPLNRFIEGAIGK